MRSENRFSESTHWQVAQALSGVLALAAFSSALAVDRIEQVPPQLQGVGVTEHLGVQLPLNLPFADSSGKRVQLRQFFDGKRPVILTLNYSNCPMLCSLQLTGLFKGMQAMAWNLGEQYQMVTISIDPKETSQRAALTKKKYLIAYGRPQISEGWHVLTGQDADIRRVAGTVGFHYTYDAEAKQYAHPAVAMICSPQGEVMRYLYGIEYDPQTLKFSLMEAAQGKVGTTLDRIVLSCFHYDADKGRYGPAAVKLMKAGGAATIVMLGGMVLYFWRLGKRRRHAAELQPNQSQATP
jgi:protein SCO1/2